MGEVGDNLDTRLDILSMTSVIKTASGVGKRGIRHAGSDEEPGKRKGQLHGKERRGQKSGRECS